ncbi:MAG TPA: Plug domain-containing protein, partial [Polyangiaceae bacterium]|nr:Plug domain-containing protein [Polyangiaceae bacterium]
MSTRVAASLVATALMTSPGVASAQLAQAEPRAPIVARLPAGAPAVETQVTLQLVVSETGAVESAVEVSRLPRDTPDAVVSAAVAAVRAASFVPTTRDGRPIRSRIEYVVVFHPTAASTATPTTTATATATATTRPPPTATPASTVEVRGLTWASPRGLGDVRVDRETLTASPRQQTSEMLSAAPGFFVDHEDGEGLGNDVYLRGFDLDNGSGIEMKVGDVPINVPLHIHGQGYADVNFIIPEVVHGIRVLEGAYDPRQGDSAIVGSALFDLGVSERGYQLKTTYGSFNQARVVGIAAPEGVSDETFAAFAMRETQGFGQDRASKSASVNAQYGVDLTDRDHL